MTFYGINYLQEHTQLNDVLKYVLIFGILLFLVFVFSLYLKHRLETKYRDLSLIALLLLLFILGVQYSDYTQDQYRNSQSSQMVGVVKEIAAEKKVPQQEVLVNSTQLVDGTIVKVQDTYYRITLNNDQASYLLEKTYLINPEIKYVLE